jgi:signal peptidase I
MYPTVKKGDSFILSKMSYGWNLHNFFFGISNNDICRNLLIYLPNKRFFAYKKPRYGDIISFRQNSDLSTKFLKRVIAVGGDRIQIKNSITYINGKPLKKIFIRSKTLENKKNPQEEGKTYLYYQETLPNNITFNTRYIKTEENSAVNHTKEFIIPEDFIFAMGDNRDNSDDSRGSLGLVPVNNIFGKASFILFSKSHKNKIFTTDLKNMFHSIIYFFKAVKYKRCFKWL